jgi:malonyl-CoA/methylmalonyl-CoA synthetase
MRSPFLARLHDLASSDRLAVEDDHVRRSFAELHDRALRARAALCEGRASLEGRRVAILVSPGVAWVEAFLGVLLGGGVALPLSPLYPPGELAWFGDDAGADALIVSADLAARAADLAQNRRVFQVETIADGPREEASSIPEIAAIAADATALLLYTSGTTGKPKGAMITHENLAVQAALLREAWGFNEDDRLLHALPLHHLHGLGISLLTTLLAGSAARLLPRFDAARVWNELADGHATTFMAVPTMYQKLFECFDAADEPTRARWAEGARSLRLATSGSAALPVTLAARWKELTGAIPLERFGMTEIGVGMSNPRDPAARRPGFVGPALPSVESRIVDDTGHDSLTGPGELYIRGPSVFKGYWNRPDATLSAFADGWFKTGDIAERSADGAIRLLGRTSVDILKSGGYKLSALEIEEALRDNPAVAEVAVIGLPDEVWGDRVVAVIVPAATPGARDACATEAIRAWARDRLAAYKIPRETVLVDALPRNPLGKVVKPELIQSLRAPAPGPAKAT